MKFYEREKREVSERHDDAAKRYGRTIASMISQLTISADAKQALIADAIALAFLEGALAERVLEAIIERRTS